jgi:hypothetical protein
MHLICKLFVKQIWGTKIHIYSLLTITVVYIAKKPKLNCKLPCTNIDIPIDYFIY